jgi:hypothetical protein
MPKLPLYCNIKGLIIMDNKEVQKAVNEVWHDTTSCAFLHSICQTFPKASQIEILSTLQPFTNTLKIAKLDTK